MCVCAFFRQKIEDLEAERQSLEQQNNVLEMRLERHNLQVGHVPAALFCDGNTRLAHRDHPPPHEPVHANTPQGQLDPGVILKTAAFSG